MNKKDLHKIIKEELDKIRSEANTKVDDQGYAGDYYHVISDIIETWSDEQTITNDIKGFLKAAFDTRGGSKAGDTKKGGEQLTRMVINAILKGIQEYRKQEPKDYMREEKADKDYDGDGKIESPSAEYKGSVDKAIKKSLKEAKFNEDYLENKIIGIFKKLGITIGTTGSDFKTYTGSGNDNWSVEIKYKDPSGKYKDLTQLIQAFNDESKKLNLMLPVQFDPESVQELIPGKIRVSVQNPDKLMNEEDETQFLGKSDFSVENLDAGDLLEYDLVLDDLMAVIKKYKWIRNLDKSVIAKQVLHDKKLVADAIKKQKDRSAIRKDYKPKAASLREAPGKGLEVIQTGRKDVEVGDELEGGDFEITYDVKLNGKSIGKMEYGSYLGDIEGTLYGRRLPDIKDWTPVGDKNKMYDEDGDMTPEGVKGKLIGFLKSKTGLKWLEILKKQKPDAFMDAPELS